MPTHTMGVLKGAAAWAAQPVFCLGLAIAGVAFAAGPRDVRCHGGVEIEEVTPGASLSQIRAWSRRHRDACASCRHLFERGRRELGSNPPPARDGGTPGG